MWIPPTASLCGVRRTSRRGDLRSGLGRYDRQAADADVDGLAGRDPSRCGELRPIEPGATHAAEVAQPVRALLVRDLRVLARHRKIRELDRALGSSTDRGARLGDRE